MTVAILMPVFNGTAALASTLSAIRERAPSLGGVTVFLVDDGSESPVRGEDLPHQTRSFRIVLARHAVNLGQGAALETARQLAIAAEPFVAYVTMDADGQHRVEDAIALARAVEEGADAAFGNRFLGDSNVPRVRRLLLIAARWFEWGLTGLRLRDAHNGLRAFSRRALERISIRQNRMAHATEIKLLVSREMSREMSRQGSREGTLRVVEVPVSVRYTRETRENGQRSLGALTILRDLASQYLFGEPQ
jgi:polyprenyl-phospho-N-acetylgalactosaminyl synthase